MNQTQALSKLRKALGPTMGYRVDPKAPTADERKAKAEAAREAKRIASEAKATQQARLEEVLRADSLYQELKAAAEAASKTARDAAHGLNSYRITVGTTGSFAFFVEARGDTWAEVVQEVCAKSVK